MGLVALVVIGGSASALWARSPSGLASRMADTVNEAGPRMLDEVTRLDGAAAGRHGGLVLRHTLIALPPEFADLASIRDALRDGELSAAIVTEACASEGLRGLLVQQLRLVNQYADADGNPLGSVVIDATTCRGHGR